MKASELITLLQERINEHGDLPVGKTDDDGDYDTVDYVVVVDTRAYNVCVSDELEPMFFRVG